MIDEKSWPYGALRFLGKVIVIAFAVYMFIVFFLNLPEVLDILWSLCGL